MGVRRPAREMPLSAGEDALHPHEVASRGQEVTWW